MAVHLRGTAASGLRCSWRIKWGLYWDGYRLYGLLVGLIASLVGGPLFLRLLGNRLAV